MCIKKEEVQQALADAIKESRKKFWIDEETHFIHHQSFDSWIKTFGLIKKSVLTSFVMGVMATLAAVFWLGFKAYMKLTGHN